MSNILITGASGFIGRQLYKQFLEAGNNLFATIQNEQDKQFLQNLIPNKENNFILTPNIDANTNWEQLQNIDVVIHLAARVHIMHETEADPLAAFRAVNVAGTKKLVDRCVEAKVKRFVFMSSIGVNGNSSLKSPFTETDKPAPTSPYTISKWEAEEYLHATAAKTDLEVVIIRPPMVYGANVKAKFLSLLNLINKGIPLPLGALHNKRAMINVKNLLAFVILCVSHPQAKNQTFLVSDAKDLSVRELCLTLSKLLNKKTWLLPIPNFVLRLLGTITGKRNVTDSLCLPIEIDTHKAQSLLNWNPPYSVEDGLKDVVNWYKQSYNRK